MVILRECPAEDGWQHERDAIQGLWNKGQCRLNRVLPKKAVVWEKYFRGTAPRGGNEDFN